MTESTPDVVQLDDLARPQYSPAAEGLRALIATLAPDCPLDSDVMHARARAETGLTDFGPDDYRDRFELYLSDLREIGMHDVGIVNFHSQLTQNLKNRLLLTDLLKRHPEIADVELAAPVVIAGLPRSGTTHLHNMLAAPATFRSMPYWESVEPFPLPSEAGVEPDPRIGRMEVAVQTVDILMPYFALMHEMTTEHVHEEIQLLANDFNSMLLDSLARVPRWTEYFWNTDQTSAYEYLATQLKAMQFLRGGRRWVLKSPQHLGQLPILEKVFPGVVVLFTHRDPVPVALSMIAMIAYSERMHRDTVDVGLVASTWVDKLERLLGACVRDRGVIPADRSMDIRFDDFMADEIGVAESVYDIAGETLDAPARAAVAGYLAGHQRGRLGRVHTSADMFGLDEAVLRERFAPYSDRFLA